MEGGSPLPAEGSFPRPQALWGAWCRMLAQARQAFMNRPFIRKRPDETVEVAFLGDGISHMGTHGVVNSYHSRDAMPHIQILSRHNRPHSIITGKSRFKKPVRIIVNVLLFFIPKLTYKLAVQPGSIPGPVPCVTTLIAVVQVDKKGRTADS